MKGWNWLFLSLIGAGLLLLGGGGVITGQSAPFAADSLAAVITEPADRSTLNADQRQIILSTAKGSVYDYLESHAKGNWRLLKPGTDVTRESDVIQAAAKVAKTDQLPALCASNGKTGYNGPLPANQADTLAVLQKIGGP